MGVDSIKVPPLPAPTETDENTTPTELTAEIYKPGDEKSTYSLPEDGSPVTIRTRAGHRTNRSQTSLLIEYFEGSKAGSTASRKPSVRVRLTPSKKGRGDHIQVTETKSARRSSVTRRIPLDDARDTRERDYEVPEGEDAYSVTSYASATEESNVSRNPIDIEIDRSHRRRRPASPLIPSGERETYQPGNISEISAIPTDSFLDGSGPGGELLGAVAGSVVSDAFDETRSSKGRSSGKDRSKNSERLKEKPERKRRSKSRAGSLSEPPPEEHYSSRRRSGRGHPESHVSHLSVADSSVLSSNLAPSHRSMDTRSMRSGASKSSINNPKLLETVEDAIRRLILPELSALKREQSKRESRRASFTSTGTSASREDITIDRRRSASQRPESTKDGSRPKERRNREARHDYDDPSLNSPSRDSIDAEYHVNGDEDTTPKRTNNSVKAAAAGAAGAATAKVLSNVLDEQSEAGERKQRERRRRRTESRARSRSLGRERYAEEYDDEEPAPAPPMPLMSEINPSEMTRTSILSAESEGPQSASEELVPEHERDIALATLTPTPSRTPIDLQHTLGLSHANVSHGDLTALPRGKKEYTVEEYETDEFGRKIPVGQYRNYETAREVSDPGDYPDDAYDDDYYNTQDVPPPLKYVPYQAGARGLSPIPSVSGYTEAEGEAPNRSSRSDGFSPMKSSERGRQSSTQSLDSVPGSMQNREFNQHSSESQSNAGYSDDGRYVQTAAGKAVRGIGANPNIVHPSNAAESAVASLIDGSMLEQSVLTSGSGYDYAGLRDSNVSYDDQSKVQSSLGVSPEKRSVDGRQEYEEERQPTPGSRSIAQSHEFSEYEIDENGRKVRTKYRHSPTSSEAAITAGAVGAAAAALKAAQEKKQATVEEATEEEFTPAGVFRNKSFKERAMEGWEPRNTPTHIMDRLDYETASKMGASGVPDLDDPMPEVDYLDDDLQTNLSVAHDHFDEEREGQWSGKATPTEYGQPLPKNDESPGMDETVIHNQDASQDYDEWQRTSDERKRDTLITNPYEDASPIVNPALNDNLLGSRGLPFSTGSPGFQKYDEGYISNGPNRTPEIELKGKAVNLSGPGNLMGGDDPFYVGQGHGRHLSGMSQGMASPFFEASTGVGIERIENKDIIALMQHLMVRDAQRSARDTEIVALLMNAALEMRNSFREIKELVQDTGDDVIFAGVENTEKLQKAINGPRPYPGAATRSLQSGSIAGTIDEVTAKKKNLWKRALQGLSAKGTSDLSRIEDMLMQLLGEVDILKTQTARPGSTSGHGQSFENLQPGVQYEQDKGYEPEGNSTISHGSQSGHLSMSQGQRKFSDHRISTVEENEEEYQYDDATASADNTANLMSPGQGDNMQRGGSLPPEAPSQLAGPASDQPLSADNTPRSDKGKKNKAGSSSWLPKISRWSGTTASTVSRALRGGGSAKKEARYDDQLPSRSGSSLASHDDAYRHDPYGEDKLHSGFSEGQLAPPHEISEATVLSMPMHMTPEDPKYKAHRNSLNLQHPQPRTGQTERFRTALEYSAQEYDAPVTPRSADWAGSVTSLNRLQTNTNRYSNGASGAEQEGGEYWPASPTQQQSGPARPPKEPVVSPSSQRTPPRATRVSALQKNSPLAPQSYESGYASAAGTHLSQYTSSSPKPENKNLSTALGVPTRRPSGPRAMTPKSPEEEAAREERRRKRDTFGSIVSQDTDTF